MRDLRVDADGDLAALFGGLAERSLAVFFAGLFAGLAERPLVAFFAELWARLAGGALAGLAQRDLGYKGLVGTWDFSKCLAVQYDS